jgi:predicted DNA-binding protein
MGRKGWVAKTISVRLSQAELEKLDKYCQQSGREYNDVIRELIRKAQFSQSEKLK